MFGIIGYFGPHVKALLKRIFNIHGCHDVDDESLRSLTIDYLPTSLLPLLKTTAFDLGMHVQIDSVGKSALVNDALMVCVKALCYTVS
jgi:hypothetical protein